ncbi:cytochrome c [Phenylobacterium sp.]|uniref:c-type cytochrome n=1 Tax=Phenylobacterium sp. TaxID=1871053 RepID=UPI00356827EA
MALRMMTAAFALAAGLGLAATGAALAQDAAPTTPGGKAVLARQAHYKDLGKAFGGVNGELRKDAPDKAAIAAGATTVKTLADGLPTWFPKGSGPEAGVKTAAKPEIWTDAAGFAAAVAKLQGETAKLQEVATAGDLDAIKAQVRATGGACKNCHDQYRAPDQH